MAQDQTAEVFLCLVITGSRRGERGRRPEVPRDTTIRIIMRMACFLRSDMTDKVTAALSFIPSCKSFVCGGAAVVTEYCTDVTDYGGRWRVACEGIIEAN